MANIEDCPGFETFGADVKAARNCSAWCGCAYYLFPAEWCDFAGYGIFD